MMLYRCRNDLADDSTSGFRTAGEFERANDGTRQRRVFDGSCGAHCGEWTGDDCQRRAFIALSRRAGSGIGGALPLGVLSGARYESSEFQMKEGSRLTFYSDGVVEAQTKRAELSWL